MFPVAVNLDIADMLQAIIAFIEQIESERGSELDLLAHRLKAVSFTVGELDRMYFVLLAEIEDVLAQPHPSLEKINAVIRKVTIYCIDIRPAQHLSELRGMVQDAAFSHALKRRRFRILASTLRSIDDLLSRYIERLDRLPGYIGGVSELVPPPAKGGSGDLAKAQKWDLGSVLELLKLVADQLGKDGRVGEGLENPREACEEAIRNYDRALSLALVQLIGHARQDLAMEHL